MTSHIADVKESGCTIFGVQGKGTIVGRNYDWRPAAQKIFRAYRVRQDGSLPYIGISDMGIGTAEDVKRKQLFFTPEDTINSAGLYIGLTFAYSKGWSHGISPTQLLSLVAERCGTVDEALSLFGSAPVSTPKNFFIADRTGAMAVVEHAVKEHQVLRPKNGVLIHTNHFVGKRMEHDEQIMERRPENDSFVRYYEVLQQINRRRGRFGLADATKILEDPRFHVFEKDRNNETIWTLALDMTDGRYWMRYRENGKHRRKLLLTGPRARSARGGARRGARASRN